MSGNTLRLVTHILKQLNDAGVRVLLGGGWAEELYGLIPPRPHKDIDLYYCAEDFIKLDTFIAVAAVQEIPAKRMPHKRAFLVSGVMVEVILIQQDSKGYYSLFWGTKKIRWPKHISGQAQGANCLSKGALQFYRDMHDQLFSTQIDPVKDIS